MHGSRLGSGVPHGELARVGSTDNDVGVELGELGLQHLRLACEDELGSIKQVGSRPHEHQSERERERETETK